MPFDLETMRDKVYTVEETAELLQRHPDSIRRNIRKGNLRAVRARGRKGYAILGEDIIRFLQGLPPLESPER